KFNAKTQRRKGAEKRNRIYSCEISQDFGPSRCLAISFAPLRLCVVALVSLLNCYASDDGTGAYSTGHYRNLFMEAGHSQMEVNVKINHAFQQLFHGDPSTQTVYYAAGANSNGPLAFITDIKHEDVRTEGLSYGIMIAVQLDKKAEFDALWNWSKTYLYNY